MATIAAEVIHHRPPALRPGPGPAVAVPAGRDDRRRQAARRPHPGLAAPQFHMSCALYAGITQRGRAAVQGAPGTGKTRQTILTAAMLAYRWRHRPSNIQRRMGDDGTVTYELVDVQKTLPPDEVRGLRRRAPAALSGGCVERGKPILTCRGTRRVPSDHRHVTQARRPLGLGARDQRRAFPCRGRAYRGRADLLRFFRRCAEFAAPAVFGIIPQSLTRCFTTVVVPDVIAESQEVTVNDLSGRKLLDAAIR